MKAIFANPKTAAAVLILTALLAVPLLGGLKLRAAYGRAFNEFEAAGRQVDKYGNSLISDMDQCVSSAEDVLTAARPLIGEDNESVIAAENAIAAYRAAGTVRTRYEAFQLTTSAIRTVHELAADKTDDTWFKMSYSSVLDRSAIIARGFGGAYRDAAAKAAGLITGFPANILAKLYNIGESL